MDFNKRLVVLGHPTSYRVALSLQFCHKTPRTNAFKFPLVIYIKLGLNMPKSWKRKGEAVVHWLTSGDSLTMSLAKEDGKELEEQAERHYKRLYGAENVETQKVSTTTGYRRDLVVKKPKDKR